MCSSLFIFILAEEKWLAKKKKRKFLKKQIYIRLKIIDNVE